MADVLEWAGDRVDDARWRGANRCRLAWDHARSAWMLSDTGATVVSTLNGARVRVACPTEVSVGDVLEVDLLRFVVEAGQATQPQSTVGEQQPVRIDGRGDPEHLLFDLCELAEPWPDGSQHPAMVEAAGGDVLAALGLSGGRPRGNDEALTALLADEGLGAALRAPAPTPAPAGLFAESALGDSGLFASLYEEFVRVVRDPSQLAGQEVSGSTAILDDAPVATMEDLDEAAKGFPLMRHILEPQEKIDRLLERFDPLGKAVSLEQEGALDVLQLFARGIEQATGTALPSLSRREHHVLSPDSHARMLGPPSSSSTNGQGRDGAKESP